MRIKLGGDRNYSLVWPNNPAVPVEERITINLQRISHKEKRRIEDSMMTMKPDQFKRGSKRGSQPSIEDITLSYSIGTIKDLQLRASVVGWEGVLDEEGKPIVFSWDNFTELLSCNAGLPVDDYGSLESDLCDLIQERNAFADATEAKN